MQVYQFDNVCTIVVQNSDAQIRLKSNSRQSSLKLQYTRTCVMQMQ